MKERNFKFRESLGNLVENMTDKQAGEFIKTVSGYVFDNKPMESKDEYLKGVYLYVKNVLDTERRDRENGKLGGAIIAEKKRKKGTTREHIVRESNIVSQLIVVASGEQNKTESRNGAGTKSMPNQGCCGTKCSNGNRAFAK